MEITIDGETFDVPEGRLPAKRLRDLISASTDEELYRIAPV